MLLINGIIKKSTNSLFYRAYCTTNIADTTIFHVNKKKHKTLHFIQTPNIKSSLNKYEKNELSKEERIFQKKERRALVGLVKNQQKQDEASKKKQESLAKRIQEYESLPDFLKILYPDPRKQLSNKKSQDHVINKDQESIVRVSRLNDTSLDNTKQTISQLATLFGEDSLLPISKTDFKTDNGLKSNKIENSPMKVVEFMYKDGISIGLLYKDDSFTSLQMKVLRLITPKSTSLDHNLDNKVNYKWELVDIHALDHIYTWNGEKPITILELIELDKEFQNHQYEFLNSFSKKTHNNIRGTFINNTKLILNSKQIASVIYEVGEPNLKHIYFSFKYLSRNNEIEKSSTNHGYRFVNYTEEYLEQFIEKVKNFIELNPISKKSLDSESKKPTMDVLEREYYFINCIHLFSLSPHDLFRNTTSVHKKVLKKLKVPVTAESAKQLLESIGFEYLGSNITLPNVTEHVNKIIQSPNSIPDPLAEIRKPFDLPVITIDPASVFGVDDGFSIEEKDNKFILYVHITDITRWISIGDPLFKKAMLTSRTSYLPESIVHMFPIPFIKICSLIRPNDTFKNNENVPIYAITIKMDFDSTTNQMETYQIFPTTLTNVNQLSIEDATSIVEESLKGGNISDGHKILNRIYKFSKDRSLLRTTENNTYENYGRFPNTRTVVRVNNRNNKSFVSTRRKFHVKGHEMIDEILSTTDDALTDFFERNEIFSFFKNKGTASFKKLSAHASFVAATSPIRSFIHLFSQFQLTSMLKYGKANYSWEEVSSVGNLMLPTLQLKNIFDKSITNHYIYQTIQNNIFKQESEVTFNPKFSKPILFGRVVAINEENYTFTIYFPLFKITISDSQIFPKNDSAIAYQDRNRVVPFKVNDLVNVTVEYFNLEKQILKVHYNEIKKT